VGLILLHTNGGRLGREHLHVAGDHLDACALNTLSVGILALREAVFDIHFGAFMEVAFADLGKLSPNDNIDIPLKKGRPENGGREQKETRPMAPSPSAS
jgi:hypothetical protein